MTTSWLKELNRKPRSNSTKTFKSYVDLDGNNSGNKEAASDDLSEDSFIDKDYPPELVAQYPSPSLLHGEIVLAEADNVLKFNTLSKLNKGVSGILICTNFKLSFLTAENFPSSSHQRNLFLAENDICLTNIDSIYYVSGGKRKKINVPNLSANTDAVEIHCKDFRIYTFSFKFSPPGNQKDVILTILCHAFVPVVEMLFTFEYEDEKSSAYHEKGAAHSLMFTKSTGWENELKRCRCSGWRVTWCNEKYLVCDSLPECFVVPFGLQDGDLNKAAPYFPGRRIPTWSWSLPTGAAIVRMASMDPSISDRRQYDLILDAIRRTNPELQVKVFDIENTCANIKEVQASFLKLKELCMPTTADEFWETDSVYMSKLEATKWLHIVSSCLCIALEAALALQQNITVVFSESIGRDLNCVLSSLVQILLDSSCHTQVGFQTLIQKEWIALGHPFTERLRHVSGFENEESPVFLVFLDCVWQLMQQCPTVFEFSETYLTTIWDSCHSSLFDTFLFSSTKNRMDAMCTDKSRSKFHLRSVWNWNKHFSRNDIKLFSNPLYILNKYKEIVVNGQCPPSLRPRSLSAMKDSKVSHQRPLIVSHNGIEPILWSEDEENLLKIDPTLKTLSVWHQCYFRWIPLAHVVGGGSAMLFLNNMKVADEIAMLERVVSSLSTRTKQQKPPSLHRRAASDDYIISADVIDHCNLQDGSRVVTSAFPFSPVAPYDWQSYQFVPSAPCLQISYSSDDDLDD